MENYAPDLINIINQTLHQQNETLNQTKRNVFWVDLPIVLLHNNMALDGNEASYVPQYNTSHKRPFMHAFDGNAQNHLWTMKLDPFTFKALLVNSQSGHCIDGNTESYVPQYPNGPLTPFMWECNPNAANHIWKVGNRNGRTTFTNEYNGRRLAFNPTLQPQWNAQYPTPYLTDTFGFPSYNLNDTEWVLNACPDGCRDYGGVCTSINTCTCKQYFSSSDCSHRQCSCKGMGAGCTCFLFGVNGQVDYTSSNNKAKEWENWYHTIGNTYQCSPMDVSLGNCY